MLSIPEAAHYLRQLILPASRRACLAYWRERFGEKYARQVEEGMKR